MTASSPASSPSSPTPTLTPDSNMLSRTPQSTTSTTTTPILYTNSAPSSVISIPSSHGHSSGTLGAPGGQPTPILSDTPSQSPRHPNTAAIAGGIVGGIILLLLILAAIFYFHRRLRALSRRQIIPSRRTSPVEMRGGDPEQERGREQGNERDDMSTILKTPALKAWSPEMFSVQSPSHSLSPTSLDYAFTRPFSLASSISPDMQAQSHSSDSRRSSTKPLLSSTLRGNLRTSTGTAASTDEEWHDAQSSASAEDLSMRSVPSRQSWYAV
ncbi:hypothetical protein C8Q74DRAFT_1373078 [Fomes fomentarius]|nr:hypothetical protein C8Q74DRAFT_1373078 [Fomes fomentarius]